VRRGWKTLWETIGERHNAPGKLEERKRRGVGLGASDHPTRVCGSRIGLTDSAVVDRCGRGEHENVVVKVVG
jgi:hypothetical protein